MTIKRKKLLFIINVDWFFLSHRLPIAQKALQQGYEVHIATKITDRLDELESFGFIVHPLNIKRSSVGLVGELKQFFEILKFLKKIEPDVIHLVTIKPVLYGGIASRIAGVPCVVSAISGLGFLFVERTGLLSRLRRYLVLGMYRLAMGHPNQRIIFQNPTDMNTLVLAGGVEKEKTKIIRGSGVDLSQYPVFPEPDGMPVVMMASRLLKDKGVVEFVEAARLIKEKGLNVRFLLIGAPDIENPESITVSEIQAWQDQALVEILGFRSDIPELFSESNIVTLPSYYGEGLPKVLIEAAACGRAVITTDMPGCRDAIEADKTGLLVPARDAVALADAIERLIDDASLRQKMGKAGRKLAEQEFSIDKVVQAHLAIYQELESLID